MNNQIRLVNILEKSESVFVNVEDKAKNKKTNKKENPSIDEIDHYYFSKNKVELLKYKIDELKFIAKKYGLRFSGTKPVLSDRIKTYFTRSKSAVIIQSLFRAWIVRKVILLRGPAFKNRKLCVNDTDFVTMEPIDEIVDESFYSYRDAAGFTYGFNISSLVQIMRMNGKLKNPYNRETITGKQITDILDLYNLCFIIYPEFKKDNQRYKPEKPTTNARQPNLINRHIQPFNNAGAMNRDNEIPFNAYNPQINDTIILTENQVDRLRRLTELRRLPITQRINNLFVEIDHLGNYTQARWFNILEMREYLTLYRTLYDIWYYRGNMTRDVRYNICPYLTPFYNINNEIMRNRANNLTYEQIRHLCLIVFENLVYTGSDDDYRRIGTFHALSALTIVSVGARLAMPWLYESVILHP
jgi:hypothetical protein